MATRNFGSAIRDRRRQLGLTQEQVATRIGSSASYLSNLESGNRRPSQQIVLKLAQTLELDARDLLLLTIPKISSFLSDPKPAAETSAWEVFFKDKSLRAAHQITDQEMEILSKVALMGEVRSTQDFIFVLKAIRQASRKWPG